MNIKKKKTYLLNRSIADGAPITTTLRAFFVERNLNDFSVFSFSGDNSICTIVDVLKT